MPDIAALLASKLGRDLDPAEAVAVAVSGGPDSVALLLLTVAAFPGRVTALTIDHGLRATAAAEASEVERQCATAGIAHKTLRWTGPKPAAGLQAAARQARYALLADWCAANAVGILLTAHHADDQAETLLMRLARGSGGGGLAGIRAARDLGRGVTLARPLLGVRRAELGAIAAAAGWAIADDPGNRDPRFARSHARALLAATPWLDVPQLARAAAHLADAEAALGWATDRGWAGRALVAADTIEIDVGGLPAEIVHRLTARVIAELAPGAVLRGTAIARLIARLGANRTATLAGIRASGGDGGRWRFSRAAPRRRTGPN